MIIQNIMNVGFFVFLYAAVKKVGINKIRHRVLRTVVNVAIAGAIYQGAWPVRSAITNKTVPAVMNAFNLKASEEEKKSIKEMFEKFEN